MRNCFNSYSDACEARPPSREHSRVSKSTDFIISAKRSQLNASNFDPQIKLTQLIVLNNQATGICYCPLLLTSAIKKATLNFSHIFYCSLCCFLYRYRLRQSCLYFGDFSHSKTSEFINAIMPIKFQQFLNLSKMCRRKIM